jgi:hypothetical protein
MLKWPPAVAQNIITYFLSSSDNGKEFVDIDNLQNSGAQRRTALTFCPTR